jgi:hypothetical protein
VRCAVLQGHLLEDYQDEVDAGFLRRAVQRGAAQLPPIGMVTNTKASALLAQLPTSSNTAFLSHDYHISMLNLVCFNTYVSRHARQLKFGACLLATCTASQVTRI